MRRSLLAAALGLTSVIHAQPAGACSVVSGYRVPTSLELTTKAEMIVVAEVTGHREGDGMWSGTVIAKPVLLLKGEMMPPSVEIAGAVITDDPRQVTVSDPRELRRPNGDALRGGCVRYVFRRGVKLVLFLARDEGGELSPHRSPFSRDAEDVADADALWVKAVREYVAISTMPAQDRPDAMRARIAALRVGDADARAIADDMAIELSGRKPRSLD